MSKHSYTQKNTSHSACGCDHGSGSEHAQAPAAQPRQLDESTQTQLRIEQMDCPTEEGLIRLALEKMDSVGALEFDLMQRVLTVTHTPQALPQIINAIKALGFTAQLKSDQSAPAPKAKPWWPLALSGVLALGSELAHYSDLSQWIVIALALGALASGALPTYKKGWIAVKNLNLNINALMSIAVTGAVLINQWPEAAMVAFLFAVAEAIEARSLDRARNAIAGLMQMSPETAQVQQPDGTWAEQPAADIPLGALIRVKPGERIALDGEVSEGQSTVNQAPITGESAPVEKTIGDKLFAGTLNNEAELHYRVTAVSGDTTLARIIHAVESAQGKRSPTQRFVDQFSRYYTPAVVLIALLVALIPPLALGAPWQEWIYRALVMLVIACPCALVISTPVTIVSALASAARHGILIKGGLYLEQGYRLQSLALDKTGTLTTGKPSLTQWQMLATQEDQAATLSIANSLAARSDHPISQALHRYATAQNVAAQSVEQFTALLGRGTEGVLDGQRYQLGNHRLIHERNACTPELEQTLFALESQGQTVIILLRERTPLALFAISDTLRETSRQAIEELRQLGIQTTLLTGDNAHTAKAIGQQVGIEDIRGELLPQDKLDFIEQQVTQGTVIGMVGDGINDAPALARANIGFAMGAAGTDTAIETADVALMNDDLRKLPAFVRLSRSTRAVLWQNIALALGIKAVFMVLTVMGEATLWMAVFADMGASLIVTFNGLRLLKTKIEK